MKIKNLSIIVKVGLPALISLIALVVLSATGNQLLYQTANSAKKIVNINVGSTITLASISTQFNEINTHIYQVLTKKAADKNYAHTKDIVEIEGQVKSLVHKIEDYTEHYPHDNNFKMLFEEINGDKDKKIPGYNEILEVLKALLDIDFSGAVRAVEPFTNKYKKINNLLNDIYANSYSDAQDKTKIIFENVKENYAKSYFILILCALVVILINVIFGRELIRSIRGIASATKLLAEGDTTVNPKSFERKDELGDIAFALIGLKDAVMRSQRLQRMLENLSLPVMLCDKEGVINYANKASKKSLEVLQSHLGISPDKIVGTNINRFYTSQDVTLTSPSKLPYSTQYQVSNEWINFNADKLLDAQGGFDGVYIDWRIVTEQVRAEKEAQSSIQGIIEAASNGDLDKRIDDKNLRGFYKETAVGMNGLLNIISEPIQDAIEILELLSKGDLSKTMDRPCKGAFSVMKNALNATIDKLQDMVMQIKRSARSVAIASSEISAGSNDLSVRTESQVASLERTATAMEQINSSVHSNSQKSTEANHLSSNARQVAERGGKVVEDAVTAMTNIEKSSQKISVIIGVIDEIAFQTNLLALNAAVEAARAGEVGKGFAVVASEVRALAGRSAAASKEIKQLINESEHEVHMGSELVNQAGETLNEIVTSIRDVASIMEEIAHATSDQATDIGEISTAIAQIDNSTQQNAALVEESSAAAESLVNQAKELDKLISFFRVENNPTAKE